MDLSRTRVVLRERATLDILDLALRFVVKHLGLYARAVLVVLPPMVALSAALAHFAGWIAAWSFAVFAATFAAAPFTVLASRLVFEGEVPVALAVRAGLGSAGRLLLLRLAAIGEIVVGIVTLVLPGVWLLALTLFTTEVALLEQTTLRGAIERSMRLAGREVVEAVSALLLLALLPVVALLAADIGGRAVVGSLLQSHAPGPVWDDGGSVLALLGFWLFIPYGATFRFLVYLDVRTRSEGWDIQTRFAAIAARYAGLALLGAGLLGSPSARAALDPDRAASDVRAAMASGDYAFCTTPADPLSSRARALCPLAGEIPGCSALVVACAKPDEPPQVDPFWKRLLKLLDTVVPYVASGFIVLLVVFALYLAARAVRAARRDDRLPADDVLPAASVTAVGPRPASPEAAPAEALLQRAAEARARGDARGALFLYLAASLRALGDRGAIRLAPDRTHGEYVQSCLETWARPALRSLVREVDAVQFGGAPATDSAARVAEAEALRILRPRRPDAPLVTPAVFVLVALALLAGCKLGGDSKDDPAGRDLLADLLEKQGVKLEGIDGSLAKLPMNGADGPAVLVDVDRVHLEESTAEHLAAWVTQGGTLVIAGSPASWPAEFWAKPLADEDPGATKVKVETRAPTPAAEPGSDDESDDTAPRPRRPADVRWATVVTPAAMTWPSEERAPGVVAHLPDAELYAALRHFGDGQILGLASAELFTNASLATPGNAEAVVAMLAATGKDRFVLARREQGVTPPDNPLAGLLRVGLGPALIHVAFFLPLLFLAYGVRLVAPRKEPPPRRRAFAEHVRAVGGLYARRRASAHALTAYARHVDDRVRRVVARGSDPAEALAAAGNVDVDATRALLGRAMTASKRPAPLGDPLRDLARLGLLYIRATERR